MADERKDVELMTAVAGGDDGAFRTLVERHQGAVYGTIVKMLGDAVEAEDLAQQVFIRVYRAAGRYEARAEFRTWLFTIVRNLVFNEHKRRQRARLDPLEPTPLHEDAPVRELPDARQKSASEIALNAEKIKAIDDAILALPEQQRLAVILRRYDEFSYEEMAGILKTTVPSVKSLLFRARETLAGRLRDYMEDQ